MKPFTVFKETSGQWREFVGVYRDEEVAIEHARKTSESYPKIPVRVYCGQTCAHSYIAGELVKDE